MKKLFEWIERISKGKIKNIRPDLAKHDFYIGYFNYAVITWITVATTVFGGLVTCAVLAIIWALFEIGQHYTMTGTGSIRDWAASCRSLLLMGTMLLIAYYA